MVKLILISTDSQKTAMAGGTWKKEKFSLIPIVL